MKGTVKQYKDALEIMKNIYSYDEEKTFMDFSEPLALFDDYTITIAPYVETKFYNGEIHTMMQARISDLIKGNWHSAFELNIGFKTQL